MLFNLFVVFEIEPNNFDNPERELLFVVVENFIFDDEDVFEVEVVFIFKEVELLAEGLIVLAKENNFKPLNKLLLLEDDEALTDFADIAAFA